MASKKRNTGKPLPRIFFTLALAVVAVIVLTYVVPFLLTILVPLVSMAAAFYILYICILTFTRR